jgi:hypothetical protein
MEAKPLVLALTLVTVPVVGCVSTSGQSASGPVEVDTIDRGPQSGVENRSTVVVRTQAAFEELWSRHQAGQPGEAGLPGVDFDERLVTGLFVGESPNGCDEVRLDNVTAKGEDLHVNARWVTVDAGACTDAVTTPYWIVSVPAREGSVAFDVAEATVDPDEGSDENGGEAGSGSKARYAIDRIDRGQDSKIGEEHHAVVQNASAWQQLWAEHVGNESASPPALDFDERTVIAVFKGQSPNTCHAANVTEVEPDGSDGDDAIAHVVYHTDADQACAMQVTAPFDVVSVETVHGAVTFDVEER